MYTVAAYIYKNAVYHVILYTKETDVTFSMCLVHPNQHNKVYCIIYVQRIIYT